MNNKNISFSDWCFLVGLKETMFFIDRDRYNLFLLYEKVLDLYECLIPSNK